MYYVVQHDIKTNRPKEIISYTNRQKEKLQDHKEEDGTYLEFYKTRPTAGRVPHVDVCKRLAWENKDSDYLSIQYGFIVKLSTKVTNEG